MIRLKQLLIEGGLYGLTVEQLLDTVLKFEGKTLIFFDTETMGLNPTAEEIQLTEVAAIAFDGGTFKEVGQFHFKVKLGEKTKQYIKNPPPKKREKDLSPADLLKMTRYGERNAEFVAEKEILQKFADFINKFPNPVLIAHNAGFDMKFINVRGKRFEVQFKRTSVIDTKAIAGLFFVPVLKTIQDKTILDKLLVRSGITSVSLGKLAPALSVSVDNWHSAFADVESMIGVLKAIVEYLKSHKGVDISKEHAKAIKNDKWFKQHGTK
jgi:DNA polymerase III alpha subunit (gram-positive type)